MIYLNAVTQPKINLKKTGLDFTLEIVAFIAMSLTFILVTSNWERFPSEIRLNSSATGAKWVLLILPFASLIFYVGMSILNRFPHKFNYPIKVTEQNAEKLYKIGVRTVSFMKMLICIMILYAVISIVSSIVYNKSIFSMTVFFIFIIGILVATVISIVKMFRVKA